MTQTKRDTPILQIGGWAWGWRPQPDKNVTVTQRQRDKAEEFIGVAEAHWGGHIPPKDVASLQEEEYLDECQAFKSLNLVINFITS
jgi:hypothetical protein